MIGWLIGLLPGVGGIISKGLDYYLAKADGDTKKAIALMEADKARLLAQRDVITAGMHSRVWWTGWALFVFPLGVYFGKVLIWDKALGWGRTDHLDGLVADWAGIIVLSIFGMQLASSIVDRVLRR